MRIIIGNNIKGILYETPVSNILYLEMTHNGAFDEDSRLKSIYSI